MICLELEWNHQASQNIAHGLACVRGILCRLELFAEFGYLECNKLAKFRMTIFPLLLRDCVREAGVNELGTLDQSIRNNNLKYRTISTFE